MSGQGLKILVVDDDDAGRYLKVHALTKRGYIVAEAALGRVAIERIASDPPDLVLLDVKLPDISGIEACRLIKSSFPHITILQTSAAFTGAQQRAAGLEGGADSYLVEPVEPEELVATVRALLRMRKAEQELRGLNETLESRVAERTRELAETTQRLAAESADRIKAEEALWHAQKLDAMGQLTGGVAHDFNNLLTVISGNLELVQAILSGDSKVPKGRLRQMIAAAQKAADRGARLTGQLLAFARRSMLRAETLDLNELIVGFAGFLQRAVGENVTLDLVPGDSLWPCRIDGTQFEAAMLNLAVNARDAMRGRGRLLIDTGNCVLDAAAIGDSSELKPGPYVRVRVRDSGVGMAPEIVERAFEPFFTTKDIGKGSGLGLSQVYGFVKQSGGHVVIDSAPASGTTVNLYLPRSEAPAEPRGAAAERPPTAVSTGGETILVVEDNEDVLEAVVTMVRELGYIVLVAPDGVAALEIIRSGQPIDLLFSDVVMPRGISGFELAREARKANSGLRVLLTSGYVATGGKAIESGEFPVIHKPYRHAELALKIRLALDATARGAATVR